jgi:hypothetical protein
LGDLHDPNPFRGKKKIMGTTNFTPLTEKDRQHNEYLEKINHAPYFLIFLAIAGVFILFTVLVLVGIF